MRILCVSDVHGHADALAAVLATAERRGWDLVVAAGDHCFPGPKPLEAFQRLARVKALLAQGIGDRALATIDPSAVRGRSDRERERLERLAAVRLELGDAVLARLAALPEIVRVPLPDGRELVVVHGSPTDATEPMTHDMSDDEISALLGDDPADIVVCGGSHVPFDRLVSGVRVVNVGSVGEAPESTSGAPGGARAHATWITVPKLSEAGEGGPVVEQFAVPLGKAA
ncbi:MAG TPA: metallophosphoesterase family protein [Byssovorax sp.]